MDKQHTTRKPAKRRNGNRKVGEQQTKLTEHGRGNSAVHRESVPVTLPKEELAFSLGEEAYLHFILGAMHNLVAMYGWPRLIKEMDEVTFWKLQGHFQYMERSN